MLSLNSRISGFRILFPKNFIHPIVDEKYSKVLKRKHSFFTRPIDVINESIQKIEVLGFSNATVQQQQTGRGKPIIDPKRIAENNFLHTSTEYNYRAPVNPIALVDRTLNIEFRHILGFLNYIILFENFWYLYSRDESYTDMLRELPIELFDESGSVFCKIIIMDPVINGMDMLSFDYTQPVTNANSFRVEFKYSNFDFEFPDRYYEDDIPATNPVNGDGSNSNNGNNGNQNNGDDQYPFYGDC